MLLFLSSFLSSSLREEEGKRRTQGSLPHQTSIPPSASAACAANLLASPGFETSHGAEKIFDDGGEDEDDDDENFALSSRSASATPEASLEQNATSSPEAKKPSTRALPMPLDPPVTTTRRGGRSSEARRGVEEEEVEEAAEAKTTPLRLPNAPSLEHDERGAIGAAGALVRVIRTPLLEASAGERTRARECGVTIMVGSLGGVASSGVDSDECKRKTMRPYASFQKPSFLFFELLFSLSLSLFLLLFFSPFPSRVPRSSVSSRASGYRPRRACASTSVARSRTSDLGQQRSSGEGNRPPSFSFCQRCRSLRGK